MGGVLTSGNMNQRLTAFSPACAIAVMSYAIIGYGV